MNLTAIGCSGSVPGPGSPASCYLIEGAGVRVVLDLGNGSLGPLQRWVDLESIDAVVLSHLHADHCLDACALAVWHRYSERSRGTVPLYGPRGTQERLSAAYELPSSDLRDVFDFGSVTAESVLRVGELTLSFTRVNHPVETHAIRVEDGSTALTYSADTGVCPALIELARGSDVLLCEAAAPDGSGYPPDLHLTGGQAGEHAAAAGVGRLLLTHIPPWVDADAQLRAAAAAFPAAELVAPGAGYRL